MMIFQIGTIRRLPLGTDYNAAVASVLELARRCPSGTEICIDGTGIGKPVADMFKHRGVAPWCVTATAGTAQTIDQVHRTANVPKLQLISRLQSLLFGGQLKVNADLADAAVFLEELRDFRVEFSASGNLTYNAKSGKHDDIISAAAVAIWRLSDGQVGWGPPSLYLAQVVAGIRPTGPKPTPWCIGVDLGKTGDPTAIVVVRRVEVDAPEFREIAPTLLQPMSPVPDVPDNRVDWRTAYEAQLARETPDHPESRAGAVEFLNGPNARRVPQPGSVEFEAAKRQFSAG